MLRAIKKKSLGTERLKQNTFSRHFLTHCHNRSVVGCKDSKLEAKLEYQLKTVKRNDLRIQYFLIDGVIMDDVNTKKCDNLLVLDKRESKTAV